MAVLRALFLSSHYTLSPVIAYYLHCNKSIMLLHNCVSSAQRWIPFSRTPGLQAGKPSMVRVLLCSSLRLSGSKSQLPYPNASEPALKGVNIEIPANSKVGFVGATGNGKTTTVDIILGHHEPQRGQLTVDGEPITSSNRPSWRRAIGYVPQQIYLLTTACQHGLWCR